MPNTTNVTSKVVIAKLKKACAERGLPYTTGRDLCLRGEIPLIRIGRALYIEPGDLDLWISAQKARG